MTKYSREYKPGVKFLQISTDEVYGALGKTGRFSEESPDHAEQPVFSVKERRRFIGQIV